MSERGKPWATRRCSLVKLNIEKVPGEISIVTKTNTRYIRNVGYEGISNMCLKSTESAKIKKKKVLLTVVFL